MVWVHLATPALSHSWVQQSQPSSWCLQHLGFLRLVAAMWPQLLVCPVDALGLRTAPPPAPGCSFPPWDLPGPGAKPVDADFKERPVSFSSLAVSRQHPLLPREKGDKFKVR